MSAKLLDGKKLADKILDELKIEISKLDVRIRLAIVLVGEDPSSFTYVNQKKKIGKKIGVDVKIYKYSNDISTRKLREKINKLNKLARVKGIIVQLPLPNHINTESILDTVKPKKDVDVLGRESMGRLIKNKSKILPPTVAGIVKLLEEYKIEYKNKNIAILGYGRLVGKPASIVFGNAGASVAVMRSSTKNIDKILKNADIIISGVGKPNLITTRMVKKGAVVMDAGISFKDGKLVGDVTGDVQKIASYITPSVGGVGPMTVAMLFYNLVQLSKEN